MPGNLAAAMLAELQAQGPVFFFWEIYLPGGVRRYSDVEVASDTLGYMAGKVVDGGWSVAARGASRWEHTLELHPTSVTIEDTDRSFSKILEGSQANAVQGSRAVLRLGTPSRNVAAASWPTCYEGILTSWPSPARHRWTLGIERNVGPLRGTLLKTPILPADWPAADPSLYARFAPRIYGIHDSRGSTNAGFIPCPLVDQLLGRHLVAQGWVTPDRVYKNGALLGSGYTVVRLTVNGRFYTVIDFTTPNLLTDVIAADVTGYESVGNGSGSLITGINCLKHLLSNFVYADYQGGNWLSDATQLHAASFAATQTFLTDMGWHKASRWYGGSEPVTGLEALNEFCKTFRLYPVFARDGKIGVVFDDHRATTLWHDPPRLLRWDIHDLSQGGWAIDYDQTKLADRITVRHVLDSSTGEFKQALEVRDLSVNLNTADELELPWLHSSLA